MLLSQTAMKKRKKKNKVTGWLNLAIWVFLLILILWITMVNFLQFFGQIIDEVFDQFSWQLCEKINSHSFQLRLTICTFWVFSNHYFNINDVVISDCIAKKKKEKKSVRLTQFGYLNIFANSYIMFLKKTYL